MLHTSSNAARHFPKLPVCDNRAYSMVIARLPARHRVFSYVTSNGREFSFQPAVNHQRWSGKPNVNVESELEVSNTRTLPRNCVAHRKPWHVILRTLVLVWYFQGLA